MILLPTLAFTAAVAAPASSPNGTNILKFQDLGGHQVVLEAVFNYGSGGTSVDAYIVTSFDGGATWFDVANFHFTTAAGKKILAIGNRTSVTAAVTPGFCALAANTAVDGVLGDRIGVAYTSAGTYVGATNLTIYAQGGRLQSQQITGH